MLVEEKPRPIGIIWGGTANRGRLKLRSGHGPENWTSGVDLGRLLQCLQLELITSDSALNGKSLSMNPFKIPSECFEIFWVIDKIHEGITMELDIFDGQKSKKGFSIMLKCCFLI